MTFNYNNCLVHISEDFQVSIHFGDAAIFDQLSASSMAAAQELARQQIDLFIGDLPPALSYKNSNHDNH